MKKKTTKTRPKTKIKTVIKDINEVGLDTLLAEVCAQVSGLAKQNILLKNTLDLTQRDNDDLIFKIKELTASLNSIQKLAGKH